MRAVIEYHDERFRWLVRPVVTDRSLAEGPLFLARLHEADPTFIRFWTKVGRESQDPDHPAHESFVRRYRRAHEEFSDAVRAQQLTGRLRSDVDAESLTDLFIAVLDGLEHHYLLDPGRMTISARLRAFLTIAMPAEPPT